MKNLFVILTTLIIFSFLQSCKKVKPLNIDVTAYHQCHTSQNYDSSSIASKLVGTWKWTMVSCFWSGTTERSKSEVVVTFTEVGTFTVMEDGVVTTQGNWQLKSDNNKIFSLDIDQHSSFITGRILFCENEVLFNHSYIDLCDNLFRKI